MNSDICLLSHAEQALRLSRIGVSEPTLVCDNANLFYLTGRIFSGYVMLRPDAEPVYYVKRPVELTGAGIRYIRKPEDMGADFPGGIERLALETSSLAYGDALRLQKALGAREITDCSAKIMAARAVKTPAEIEALRADGISQSAVYRRIPRMFTQGMTDIELQAAIEYASRLEGCLGIFRVNGPSMELHMGSVLTGENADTPSPYDFAMGGRGISPALPVGASGEQIKPGAVVMVDMNGCFNGYMTDMTRMFVNAETADNLDPMITKAWHCSRAICSRLAADGKPGTSARELYETALAMAHEQGLGAYFMGHRQHAGFVGHGVGIQVNELPVLAPRSKAVLAEGNVIAIEPKFVLPGIGAIGIENTYVVTPSGLECLTNAPEEITALT
ncbi:MAG: Xaa-Pro peptidase family protein [Muribaculaceae bacterium]|nr:Xaa-Pro peptidase family protein [Muribaculaceae bacterium]